MHRAPQVVFAQSTQIPHLRPPSANTPPASASPRIRAQLPIEDAGRGAAADSSERESSSRVGASRARRGPTAALFLAPPTDKDAVTAIVSRTAAINVKFKCIYSLPTVAARLRHSHAAAFDSKTR